MADTPTTPKGIDTDKQQSVTTAWAHLTQRIGIHNPRTISAAGKNLDGIYALMRSH